jgi:hypothetical protein
MSSITINGDTSGSVILQAPSIAGSTTLTLPSTSGTILTSAASQTLTTPNVVGPLTLTSGGITFNANPGGGTQATLNDYEVGSFTPTVAGSSSAGTATYGTQIGAYVKIGNLAFVTVYMGWTSGTGTGQLLFNGLPFTAISSPVAYQGLTMSGVSGLPGNTAGNVIFGRINTGESRITVQAFSTGTTISDTSYPYASSGTLLFTGCYRTAS